jgi:predicted transcriptional regulator
VIVLKNEKLNLSNIHQETLTALVNLYQKKGCAVKALEIVKAMNHLSPGTIRNQMQTMKALELVKSRSGAKGGYLPTELAYENLEFRPEGVNIPIYRNEEPSGVILYELRLKPPYISVLHVIGDISDFKVGDRIKVVSNKLIISGRVEGRNDHNNSLLSSIEVAFLRK